MMIVSKTSQITLFFPTHIFLLSVMGSIKWYKALKLKGDITQLLILRSHGEILFFATIYVCKETQNCLMVHFYWPGIHTWRCIEVVCDILWMSGSESSSHPRSATVLSSISRGFLQKTAMDFVRPTDWSAQWHHLMLVVIDYEMLYLGPMPHQKNLHTCAVEELFWTSLKDILIIQGTFILWTLHKLYELSGIMLNCTSSYHPWIDNGMISGMI